MVSKFVFDPWKISFATKHFNHIVTMAINPLVSKPSLKLCLDVISVGKSAAGDAVPENKDPFVGNIIHHHMHNSLNHIIAANTNNPEADAVDN